MKKAENKNSLVVSENLQNFYIFSGIYLASILCAVSVSARIISLYIPFIKHSFFITGGTFIIPLAFFAQDIITEVFGYKKAQQTVLFSTLILSFFICYWYLLTLFPCPSNGHTCTAYNAVGASLPRHLFAFVIAFSIGIFSNNYTLIKLKTALKSRHIVFRFLFATFFGELILQIVGTTIAWFGNMNFTYEIIPFIAISLSYKILFEIVMIPISVHICNKL